VADLLWDDVKDMFDPDANGVLPDVRVGDTTLGDWQAVLDLVRSSGWHYDYQEGGRTTGMPARVEPILAKAGMTPIIRVWPSPDWSAIFRPCSANEIEFDVDLRELQGQQRLDELCAFLRTIGQRLGKLVTMYPEGSDQPDLEYAPEADRVVNLEPPHRPHPQR
jgi:hypothetical protein